MHPHPIDLSAFDLIETVPSGSPSGSNVCMLMSIGEGLRCRRGVAVSGPSSTVPVLFQPSSVVRMLVFLLHPVNLALW